MNADKLARWYRLVEYLAFGSSLNMRRRAFLGEVLHVRRALVLGEGDGRFLSALLKQNSQSTADYIDGSVEMLRLARSRVGSMQSRVSFAQADLNQWTPSGDNYDLVATHFFFDCLHPDQCARLIERVSQKVSPNATWIVSEFRVPARGPSRTWARFWIWLSYLFFRLTTKLETHTIPDYSRSLSANGFTKEKEVISTTGLLVSQLWRKATPLHSSNASPVAPDHT